MLKFAPSILSADFRILGEQIEETRRGGAEYVHIDVMDGNFVPQVSFGDPVIKTIRPCTDQVFDVHLMVVHPELYIQRMADAGADIITFHMEAAEYPGDVIRMIRDAGKKVGLSIKPRTPVEAVIPYMKDIDMLLIMTVEPGFGGQKYIPESTDRIRSALKLFRENGLTTDIEVDGGIKRDNVDVVLEAGANVIVAGSAVFAGDVCANTRSFSDHFREWEASHPT